MASVGEPLNPEAVVWGEEAFGKPFHDNWWQTETGGIMISNLPRDGREAGLDGRRCPASPLASSSTRRRRALREVIDRTDTMGELALRPGWPSMMRAYLNEEERYRKCFAGGWYLTGDLAMRDSDGYLLVCRPRRRRHQERRPPDRPVRGRKRADGAPGGRGGRRDRHSGPDRRRGRQGLVALKTDSNRAKPCARNCSATPASVSGRRWRQGNRLRQNLPKTRSGKIMRRLLKARELGLPEGDISTLESEER
jgi:acetyl-CoA synthetase